jgi:peptide/nickel transport system permease protein
MRTIATMLKKNRFGIGGLIIVIAFLTIAILAPFLAPYDPIEMHLDKRFLPSSSEFLLGTDEFGRDTLSRIIYGARVSISISVTTVAIAMFVGVLIGSISGYYGGKVDFIVMRFVDIFNSFPALLLALGIITVLGRGIEKLMLVLPILFWPEYARITRGLALYLEKMDYVEAARVFGSSKLRVVLSHILPNVLPTSIVIGTFQLGSAIITETSLSFLGLGVNPPMPSWGNMLTNAREYILRAPQLAIIPGMVITIVILGFNLLGDALRDALDPRLRI